VSFRAHEIPVLMEQGDIEGAWAKVLKAFVAANGSRTKTASILGCSRATLAVWCKKLGIEQRLRTVEEILKKEGVHHGRRGGAGWHRNRRRETSDPF
jgi:DNA invertase Pin-like site-specific DNA recombinase